LSNQLYHNIDIIQVTCLMSTTQANTEPLLVVAVNWKINKHIHQCLPFAVAPEAVWQVWRPSYQSGIRYDGTIPICWNLGSWFSGKIIKIVAARCQIERL